MFSADIEAYLNGRALPGGSWRYRAAKFARRNRMAVGFSGALAALAIVGAISVITESHKTAREAQSTAAIKDFLLGLFAAGDPKTNKGKDPTLREVLDRGARLIDKDLNNQPALQAEVKAVLGGIYARRALYPQATELQEQAVAGLDATGDHPVLAAIVLRDWAESERNLGHWDKAQALLDQSLDRMRRLPEVPASEFCRTLYLRAYASITKSEYANALTYAEEEERVARRSSTPKLIGSALEAQGAALWGMHDYARAERSLREAIVQFGDDRLQATGALQSLSLVLQDTQRFREALESAEQAVEVAQAQVGERHPYVAKLQRLCAEAHYELGDFGEARRRIEHSLALQRELLGPDDVNVAESLAWLGAIFADGGDPVASASAFEEALQIYRKKYGSDDFHTLAAATGLAHAHSLSGALDLAESELRLVLEAYERHPHVSSAVARAGLGEVRRQRGDFAEAMALERAAIEKMLGTDRAGSRELATARYSLGLALLDAGEVDEAQDTLRLAAGYFQRIVDRGEHPLAAPVLAALGRALALREPTRAEAADVLSHALSLESRFFGEDAPQTMQTRVELSQLGTMRVNAR